MNWMAKLYETYEQGLKLDLGGDERLMPIGHTLQNAHINVVVDGEGNFISAKVLEKTQIVLPATEKSAGRSSGEAPHPLADKLQYAAGDYATFGGLKKAYFNSYKAQLERWCESEYGHPHIQAVYRYVEKGQLIRDLVGYGICHLDDEKLLTSWPHEATEESPIPLLFKVLPKKDGKTEQGDALICWSVHIPGSEEFDTWRNESIQQNWIAFDAESAGKSALCLVAGEGLPLATNHPAKLRHTGDKAKLISANDSAGFTYRGRFTGANHVANVSFEVTQKAHNALRWLIGQRKQAYRNGDQVVVAWAVSGKPMLEPLRDLTELIADAGAIGEMPNEHSLEATVDEGANLGQQFAISLKRFMQGYYQNFENTPTESVVIMGLDSATPGRMGITYYREYMAKEYLDIVSQWHIDFAWHQRVTKEVAVNGKNKKIVRWLIGAPSPWNILQACYGDIVKNNESLKKNVIERLLPCIAENRPFPRDLMQLSVNRASNPAGGERWEWERNLGIACSLYRGFHKRSPYKNDRRDYSMALETENTRRDYLYGRLLAVAERIEEMAMYLAGESARSTQASRLMQRFADRPYSTWVTIEKSLVPYLQRLRSRVGPLENAYKDLFDEIFCKFESSDDFKSDTRLEGEYLLGFHCQRKWLKDRRYKNGEWVLKATDDSQEIAEQGEL